MAHSQSFIKTQGTIFRTLNQYVPVVARVHGDAHPEFHEVRALFDTLHKKAKEAGAQEPDLAEEFRKLQETTKNYTVPDDVCETFEAVYQMLSELDQAYHSK